MDKGDITTLIFLEAMKTRREGMVAENQQGMLRGESLAYTEDAFAALELQIRELLKRI